MSPQRESENNDNLQGEDLLAGERAGGFFGLNDEDELEETRGPILPKLIAAGLMLLVSLIALLLLVSGVRTYSEARENEGYENKSWVIQGTLEDLTKDLQGDKNVGIYAGALPDDEAMNDKTFVSDVADSVSVGPNQGVKFRGSQTGRVKSDFPEKVDALLVENADGNLTVARTGETGTLVPVTESTVGSQKANAMLKLGGAILVFGAGVVGTFFMIRKKKEEV
ncbi:Uncharacterised protein [Mycobacteroides abscessus subsp. bolletii]|nr:Uncharacterised protein [Mycobacteroides abscessus subsp. bolletii]